MEFIKVNPDTAIKDAISSMESEERLVLCGTEENKEMLQENFELSQLNQEEIINSSCEIDIDEWFKVRRREFEEDWAEDWDEDISKIEGDWPGEIKHKQGFTIATDILSGKPLKELYGAKLKPGESWKIPAHFKYGGWNECPEAVIQCAIWRYWEEKYGAKIITISSDTIEAYISNPPATKEEAIKLAWEQYLYCSDIVEQGVETINNLAATLLNNECWFFWWD